MVGIDMEIDIGLFTPLYEGMKHTCAMQIFRPSLFLSTYEDCQIQRNKAEFSCNGTYKH